MKLSKLLEGIDCKTVGFVDREITSLCADSRVSGAGDLLFCYAGTRVDGHLFAEEGERRGVAAIVCERPCAVKCPQIIVEDGREAMAYLAAAFYSHPERRLKTVGITGTNGKTTTAHLLYHIFRAAGASVGLVGTLGARYGERTFPPELTTPDPITLFSLLDKMVKGGVDTLVMEVSAHALALKKTAPICFDGVVFTNLTHDHLDFFQSMEEYGRAKKSLFTPKNGKIAIVNADDPFSKELTALPRITYGLDTPADCFAIVEQSNVRASQVMLNLCDELCECRVNMTGKHNVYNALAAAACAQALGVSAAAIGEGISACKGVEGRLEYVGSYRGGDIFVDFAHTPDGLYKVLSALKEECKGRLVVLFGCGGNRDEAKRPKMGEIAAKLCYFAILTADNPRYEDPCDILAQMEAGYKQYSRKYVVIESREKATEYALNFLKTGDVLLVAGKGGECYQEIMGIKYGYNDKAVILRLIGE